MLKLCVAVPILHDHEVAIFKMTVKEVFAEALKRLALCGYTGIEQGKEFVYAAGEIPIMLVAHVDTVHTAPPKTVLYDRTQGLLWSPEGLGADDRAGVIGIFEMLNRGFRPHVLFTDGEEKFGTGATEVAQKLMGTDVNYVVELDRRDGDEAVFYDCDNKEFKQHVLGFGFRESWGTFSDISIICPDWDIAGVNLSTGYYKEHTQTEYFSLADLWRTLGRLEKMLSAPETKQFKFCARSSVKPWYSRFDEDNASLPAYSSRSLYDDTADWVNYRDNAGTRPVAQTNIESTYYLHSEEFTTVIYADDLVDLYGGDLETWAMWLTDNYGDLLGAAERAILEEIDKKLLDGDATLPPFMDVDSGKK